MNGFLNDSPVDDVLIPSFTLLNARKFHLSSLAVIHKEVKISDKKEQRFGDIVTPFSSSNAKTCAKRYASYCNNNEKLIKTFISKLNNFTTELQVHFHYSVASKTNERHRLIGETMRNVHMRFDEHTVKEQKFNIYGENCCWNSALHGKRVKVSKETVVLRRWG